MIKNMEQCELDAVLTVADKMVTAAKTAPKASGQDSIVAAVVTGEDKDRLAMAMREIGKREEKEFCIRDAGNVDNRVMYSAGRGAIELGLLPDKIRVCYGIPLNATSKSIYFDRNPGAVLF